MVTAFAGVAAAATAGDITGKVKLTGTPPEEKTISLDAICGKLAPDGLKTRHYVKGADDGLGNVFVYLKSGAKPAPPTKEAPLLDQVHCEYVPYVMGVQTGQKFKIRNSDKVLHNVHSTPKNNKEFNFGQPVPGQVNEKSFDNAEVLVRFKCDVHPWMFAYVSVMEHPYFAVTDKDGNFKIEGVPAGDYVVEAVHLKAGKKEEKVTVGGDGKKVDFTLAVPPAQ